MLRMHKTKKELLELIVDIKESVRGARVYIMSSPNTSDKIMALNLAIDAAKRASAKEIIVIIPYFPITGNRS